MGGGGIEGLSFMTFVIIYTSHTHTHTHTHTKKNKNKKNGQNKVVLN